MAPGRGKTKDVPLTTLTLKLSVDQRERLQRIVELRAREIAQLTGQELNITASDIVRWLIDREAEARGIHGSGPGTAPADTEVAPTMPMSSTMHVPVSSTMPEVLRPLTDPHTEPGGPAIPAEPTMISEVEGQPKQPSARTGGKSSKSSTNRLRVKVNEALKSGRIRQRDLAEAAGVSRSMVSRFVRGEGVAADTVARLARGYAKLEQA